MPSTMRKQLQKKWKTHHCRPCHGEKNGVDYRTSLFVSCRQPCHGEINDIDYRTLCSDHAIEDEQR